MYWTISMFCLKQELNFYIHRWVNNYLQCRYKLYFNKNRKLIITSFFNIDPCFPMHFFHRCTSFFIGGSELWAMHALLPSVLGLRWIKGPLIPPWVDQTGDSLKGQDQDYKEGEPIPQTWVCGGFQLCGQQYADGNCHATTQCLSTTVLGICFKFQASACQ